ncbi:MAG: hypothetical protein K2F61_04465 [Muribaculaceae bacterium]|nr:hypothetical protein [Muribaculaceae bacterium]MDE6094018.1 hypothetical protein [Muribaculaceae bacterium]
MKKLILLSLSVAAAAGISMNAAVVCDSHHGGMSPEHTHVRKSHAVDPFEGIDLDDMQKARLNEVFGAIRVSQSDPNQAQKVMAQIRKVLTPEQYIRYVENVATEVTSRMLRWHR